MKTKQIKSNKTFKFSMVNKKIKIFIIMAFFIFSFTPLISANIECLSNLGTFEQDSQIELFQSCPTCSFVNITSIKLTDGTITNINQLMTQQGSSYSFVFNNTSEVGEYFYTTVGDKNGNLLSETICFNVTPTGNSDDTLWFNMIFIILLILGSLWTVNEYGEKSKEEDNQIYYYLAAFLLMVIGVITYFFGLAGYITLITQALSLIVWGLGFFFMVKPWATGREWHF